MHDLNFNASKQLINNLAFLRRRNLCLYFSLGDERDVSLASMDWYDMACWGLREYAVPPKLV